MKVWKKEVRQIANQYTRLLTQICIQKTDIGGFHTPIYYFYCYVLLVLNTYYGCCKMFTCINVAYSKFL